MANVQVIYRGGVADSIGAREESIEARDVADILAHIKSAYGKEVYKTAKSMVIAVNDISILKQKVFKTKLTEGDTVSFLPIAGGG